MKRGSRWLLPIQVLVTGLAWVLFWIIGLVMFPIVVLDWLVTLPFDPNGRIHHLLTSFWATMYLRIHPGWRVHIEGRGKLPRHGAAILVVNHQSQVDALVCFALFTPFKPVSKAEVRWIPIFGWNLMMNRYILLRRGHRASVARMAEDCRYWLRRGVPVMIYPEGTRSPDGEIQEFKNGAFTLAVEENCAVYPIIIDGTADALPKNSLLLGLRANIRARVLDPAHPDAAEFGGPSAPGRIRAFLLRDQVRATMIRELAALRAERGNMAK